MMLITTIISMSVKPCSADFVPLLIVIAILPTGICGALGGYLIGTAVDRSDAGLIRIVCLLRVFRLCHPGIGATGNVFGNRFEISGLNQIVESLRRFLLVERMGLD